jgi:hypothetical protein
VPSNVEYVELEVETPDDVILDNGQIRLKTKAEKLEEEKRKKLTELKNYVARLLEPTDYVIMKIAEAQAKEYTDEVEQLKQKYVTQLQQRETIRQWNNQMKQVIQNSQTIEELRSIKIELV